MDPIRIAIVGGGLGGACLANGLIAIPHVDIHVFEAKPEFSERGASVGLHRAATSALDQVLPSRTDMLKRAGAVAAHGSHMNVVRRLPYSI